MQKDVDKVVSTIKQLAFAYKNFAAVMDCMYNKYGESEDLQKIQDEVREMFVSFYEAAA